MMGWAETTAGALAAGWLAFEAWRLVRRWQRVRAFERQGEAHRQWMIEHEAMKARTAHMRPGDKG